MKYGTVINLGMFEHSGASAAQKLGLGTGPHNFGAKPMLFALAPAGDCANPDKHSTNNQAVGVDYERILAETA